MFAEINRLLSWQGGPVNWDLAGQAAAAGLGAESPVTDADVTAVRDVVRLADLWLDEAATFPSGVTASAAWWPIRTLPPTGPRLMTCASPATRAPAGALSAPGKLISREKLKSGSMAVLAEPTCPAVGKPTGGAPVGVAFGSGAGAGLPLKACSS